MRAYRGGHGGLFDLLRGQFGLGWYKHDRAFGLGLACAVHNQLQCPRAGVGAGEPSNDPEQPRAGGTRRCEPWWCHLWARLCAAYRVLRLESVTKGDNVFRDLVLARIIEPRTSPMPPAFVSRDGLKDRVKWRSDSSQPGPLARPCGYDVRRPHHRRGDTRQLYDRNDRAMCADADRRARMPGNYQ
jgi:hypothetical protein